ncbi:MAG: tRNA (adenosine(37)-N6)-dimethylallyltransferase MiaA [Candidatus Omnitrophota bacterium]|nr:tRNA (adenosine(37)-N6)-dimethylallyltransferase MiaA [Candidatus Omnitrophota bacterium]
MKPRIIFLVGPTAIGKTEIAVAIAKKINAEIISCDSMQVYKGMDIITSKPPFALRRTTPHHLISAISPDKEYNVSRYYKDVVRKIKEILKRGKIPLIVGGTGLYMSILIDGIFKSSASSKVIRNRLYRQAERLGNEYLYNRLKDIDPEATSKIHPHDTKRIVRALEVFEATGQPISKLQKQRKGLSQDYDIKIFGLNMPREKLYQKIEERVERMFTNGLVDEAKRLLKLKLSKTAAYAIGIKELKGYLDGLYDLDEAKRLIKRNTRLYAKRQLTWFRKDKRISWFGVGEKETPASVANRIFKKLRTVSWPNLENIP